MSNYDQVGKLNLIEESDLEIKIIPSNKINIVQIASPFLRGTLAIDEHIDKEDFKEITSIICEMLEDLSIPVDDKAPSL